MAQLIIQDGSENELFYDAKWLFCLVLGEEERRERGGRNGIGGEECRDFNYLADQTSQRVGSLCLPCANYHFNNSILRMQGSQGSENRWTDRYPVIFPRAMPIGSKFNCSRGERKPPFLFVDSIKINDKKGACRYLVFF